MRTALMWTVNDFPAYGMLSGWSTARKKACPHCMDDTEADSLLVSKKVSWFDCHRKFLEGDHPFRRNRTGFKSGEQVLHNFVGYKSGEEILNDIETKGFVKETHLDNKRINGPRAKVYGWNRRSIFWDLPYWKDHIIRHNLDPMHIEKNVFDNIFNTMLNIPGKT